MINSVEESVLYLLDPNEIIKKNIFKLEGMCEKLEKLVDMKKAPSREHRVTVIKIKINGQKEIYFTINLTTEDLSSWK